MDAAIVLAVAFGRTCQAHTNPITPLRKVNLSHVCNLTLRHGKTFALDPDGGL